MREQMQQTPPNFHVFRDCDYDCDHGENIVKGFPIHVEQKENLVWIEREIGSFSHLHEDFDVVKQNVNASVSVSVNASVNERDLHYDCVPTSKK